MVLKRYQSQIFLYIVLFQYSHLSIICPISVDRVGNFGDSDVLGFLSFSSLQLLRCVARFLRWILCFLTFVLMMYLLTVLGDGRRNDEKKKIGIVSEVGFMGEFIKCCTFPVHGCIYVRLCESDKGSVFGGLA